MVICCSSLFLCVSVFCVQDHNYRTPIEKDNNCWYSERDKLLIWEPEETEEVSGLNRTVINQSTANKNNGLCLFNNVNKTGTMSSNPYTGGEIKFVSLGNSLNVELNLNPLHATLSYFKYDVPLFEATYEFVHGPLCGPSIIHPVDEGELIFPRFDAMGFVEPPKNLECIWEIRVNKDRDLWLHFNQVISTPTRFIHNFKSFYMIIFLSYIYIFN